MVFKQYAVDVGLWLCFNHIVETDAYIALGSNLGDPKLNVMSAAAEIDKLPASKVNALSPLYETSPVGVTDQPQFCNAVLQLKTRLSPFELLKCLQQIETGVFKRSRTLRWGPRTIDLDLLLYGCDVIDDEALLVPHPRMAERRFVLQPLCDISPNLVHPVLLRTISELLDSLQSDEILKMVR